MTRILFTSILISGLLSGFSGGDNSLEGKWRSEKPMNPGDDTLQYDYEFLSAGTVKINTIEYKWSPVNKYFSAVNATMFCAGDNDHYQTENGYLLMEIRENFIAYAKKEMRFRLKEDTLWLWDAEVYRGSSTSLSGAWLRQDFLDDNPKKKTFWVLNFMENQDMVVSKFGESAKMKFRTGGEELEISSDQTSFKYNFELFPKMLGLYKPETEIKLIRKK